MAGLLEKFKEKLSKSKVSCVTNEAGFDVMYQTGFLSIDYLNGTRISVNGNDRNFEYDSVGLVDGSTCTFIGRTGSGKSTLLTQIVGNIIRPFVKKGMKTALFIDDLEGSLPMSRKEFLLGLTEEELSNYVDIRNYGITTENVFERIKAIRDEKIQNRKDYEYDTGLFDTYGNRIFKLVPTVYVIDSLPMLMPEDMAEDDGIGGNMSASAIAKSNTAMFKKISQFCKEANIMLFTINHILDNINVGFIPKQSQISGLAQDERLGGGGKTSLYLANNMFRVDDSLTLKAKDGYKIDGSVVKLTLLKSRTNATKRSVPLIFNKTEGRFDPVLSLFHLLKTEGLVQGAGVSLYIKGAEDIRFSQGNFKEKLENSPELQKAFAEECYKLLSTYLSETRNAEKVDNNAVDNINNMFASFGNCELATE